MRTTEFRKFFQGVALAATVAAASLTAPAVASAQPTGDAGMAQTTTTDNNRDDGFDWGWLGLLGLAGLLGLRRRDPVHHVDATTRRV